MDGWMDKKQMKKQMDCLMDGWIEKTHEKIDGQKNR